VWEKDAYADKNSYLSLIDRYSVDLSSIRMLQIDTDFLIIMLTTFPGVPTWMTLNDLEIE